MEVVVDELVSDDSPEEDAVVDSLLSAVLDLVDPAEFDSSLDLVEFDSLVSDEFVSLATASDELVSDASLVSETTSLVEESPVSESADRDLIMASIADEPLDQLETHWLARRFPVQMLTIDWYHTKWKLFRY